MAIAWAVDFTQVCSNLLLPWLWTEWYFCIVYKKMPWKIKVGAILQIHLALRINWGSEWRRWVSLNWHRNAQPCCWSCPAMINVAHKKITRTSIVDRHEIFFVSRLFFYWIDVVHQGMLQPHQVRSSKGEPWKKTLAKGGGSRAASFSISLQLDWSKCNTKPHKGWLAEKGGPRD